MSKSKRFKYIKDFQPATFVDLETGKHYNCEQICDLLNKKQEELNNFKPVLFKDILKGTVILYSKGDNNE